MNVQKEWFVGWGTLALITAALAQAKGRSGLTWFFGSVLMGPLGLFILLLLPSRPR